RRAGDQRHLAVQSPHLFLHRVGGRAIIPHPAGVHHHRRARSSRELPAVSSDVVRPRRVLTAALCVAIASLGISTTAPQAGAATHVSRPKAAAPKLDWKGCGGDNECAKLTVPLDYDHPDNGKTIKVALLRVRATDKKRRIGSLLVNPGGPGASGVKFARDFASILPDEIKARFDIVGFDPRGSGATAPVKCEDNLDGVFSADYSPDTPAERADLDTRLQELAQSCEARSGNLLPY